MSLKVENPGLLTTIQDGGRFGYQREGVVVSGGMDLVSLRMGNILVGNDEYSPVLEVAQLGPKLRFEACHVIAVTGAEMGARLNGEQIHLWRPLYVEKGDLLEFSRPASGRFGYIAVAGGFEIKKVLGSFSTYQEAGIGGWEGRALKKEDVIPCNGLAKAAMDRLKVLFRIGGKKNQPNWCPASWLNPVYEENPILRVINGPEYELFSKRSRHAFWEGKFKVTEKSNRMGYQLTGPGLSLQEPTEILSSAVTFGTVQVPAGGNPIILGADRQTIGGYPRIAQVISADLPKFVQVQPGKIIRFQRVSLDEAQQAFAQQELNMENLKKAIRIKLSYKNEYLHN